MTSPASQEVPRRAIEDLGFPGRLKVCCFPFGLFPRLLWPLQEYTIAMTRVEAIERMVSSHLGKWLWVPRHITNGALYSSTSKLMIPTSLVEEFKVVKSRMYMMMWVPKDPVVRAAQPDVDSGRNWKVAEAVEEAKSRLWMKEVVGAVQQDRRGLGGQEEVEKVVEWWYAEEHRWEEKGCSSHVSPQGASTGWEIQNFVVSSCEKALLEPCVCHNKVHPHARKASLTGTWSGQTWGICKHLISASCCDQSMTFC